MKLCILTTAVSLLLASSTATTNNRRRKLQMGMGGGGGGGGGPKPAPSTPTPPTDTTSSTPAPTSAPTPAGPTVLVYPDDSVTTDSCVWESPPNYPAEPSFPTDGGTSGSCIDRINYWRARACEEGWSNCPASGILPPMTECTCCNQCANAQAQYNSVNGAHSMVFNCGEFAQGEAGGDTCADAIDSFMEEIEYDSNGIPYCPDDRHCTPIVAEGCQTFSWGVNEAGDYWSLNYNYYAGCVADECNAYCNNPDSGKECFEAPVFAPDTTGCSAF